MKTFSNVDNFERGIPLLKSNSTQNTVNVAIYIRVSTKEQATEGFSIDAQRHNLQENIRMKGKRIIKEYVDEGISGKSMDSRHAIHQLLEDAKQGLFQEVVVWKFSRLARNICDFLSIVERLEEHGITIYSLTENFETKSSMGRFLMQMMGAVAELEINNIRDNVQHGMVQRVKEGNLHGIISYGYRKNPVTDQIEVFPEEADVVKEIFEAYDQGKGLKMIANQLNQREIKTLRGKHFHVAAIRRILHNPSYIGKVRIKDKINKISIVTKGKHEALISQDLWDRVHLRYQKQSKKYRHKQRTTYLLNGLLKCPECGGSMCLGITRNKNKDGTLREYAYYQCSRYYSMGNMCKPNAIPQQKIERAVVTLLTEWLNQPLFIEGVIEDINSRYNNKLKELHKELEVMETENRKNTQKEKEIFKLFEKDQLDPNRFKENISLIKTRREEISEKITKLRIKISKEKEEKLMQGEIREKLETLKQYLNHCTKEKPRELFEVLIDKITISQQRNIESIAIHIKNDVIPNSENIIIQQSKKQEELRKVAL